MSKKTSGSNRIQTIQVLRAIAFMEIFLGHCGVTFFTGAFGVSIFIVLSGFCMAMNYLPKIENIQISFAANVKYAVSKVKNLYGLHLVMLVCAYLLAKTPTSAGAIKRLVMDALLVQSWSPHADDYFSYNGVAWYLSTYLFILILAPWVMKVLSKWKKQRNLIAGMTAVFAGMVGIGLFVTRRQIPIGNNFAFWLTYISPIYKLLEFVMGAAFGALFLTWKKEPKEKVYAAVLEMTAIAAFVGVICIFHKIEGVYQGLCYTALFTPVSMLLVYVFAHSRGIFMKILNNPVLLWMGNLSSNLFLIHQVVIRWLMTVLDRELLGEFYIFILTMLSFAISAAGAELVVIIRKRGRNHGK